MFSELEAGKKKERKGCRCKYWAESREPLIFQLQAGSRRPGLAGCLNDSV